MKLKVLILASVLMAVAACSDSKKPEDEKDEDKTENKEEANGRTLMFAYADSLSTVADSLENTYDRLISEMARTSPDSQSFVTMKYKAAAKSLNSQIADFNQKITDLKVNNKITDADFQEVVADIDMSGVSAALEKLSLLNVDLNDGAKGDTTSANNK